VINDTFRKAKVANLDPIGGQILNDKYVLKIVYWTNLEIVHNIPRYFTPHNSVADRMRLISRLKLPNTRKQLLSSTLLYLYSNSKRPHYPTSVTIHCSSS
jgi:hypothetical protein